MQVWANFPSPSGPGEGNEVSFYSHSPFWAESSLKKEFMAAHFPEFSAFSQIRKTPSRFLSTSFDSQLPSAPINLCQSGVFQDVIFTSAWQMREASFQQTVPGEAAPEQSLQVSTRSTSPHCAPTCPIVHPLCTLDLPITSSLPPQDSQFPSAVVGGEECGGNNDHS